MFRGTLEYFTHYRMLQTLQNILSYLRISKYLNNSNGEDRSKILKEIVLSSMEWNCDLVSTTSLPGNGYLEWRHFHFLVEFFFPALRQKRAVCISLCSWTSPWNGVVATHVLTTWIDAVPSVNVMSFQRHFRWRKEQGNLKKESKRNRKRAPIISMHPSLKNSFYNVSHLHSSNPTFLSSLIISYSLGNTWKLFIFFISRFISP